MTTAGLIIAIIGIILGAWFIWSVHEWKDMYKDLDDWSFTDSKKDKSNEDGRDY